jgi:prohibitin 2
MRRTGPTIVDASDGRNPNAWIPKFIGIAVTIFILLIAAAQSTYVVEPGFRGVKVTLGKVSPEFLKEGFGFKAPFITSIEEVMVRQQTHEMKAECYSSDLQQVNAVLQVLYRVPEQSAVKIFQEYAGAPFDSLIAPRVQEALKEVTALHTAEMIVKQREDIKMRALEGAKRKVGTNFLEIVDVVIQDLTLSHELETAIEQKMVREQEANKARFAQEQAKIDADTAIIKAKGEAESITIRGEALKVNAVYIDLQIVEKWDGESPLVIGGKGSGVLMQLPAEPRRP